MARKSRKNINVIEKETKPNHKYIAGAYTRMSVEDNAAIGNQETFIMEYMKRSPDIFLHKIYSDDGVSSFLSQRPEFDALIQDIKNKIINCVIVKDLSRFGRDYIETAEYIEQNFPMWGIRFISILDEYDSDNYSGVVDISLALRNIINTAYSRDLSKKVSSAISVKQEHGEYIGAKLPFGYKKHTEKDKTIYAIDGEAAKIIKHIFSLALEEKSAYDIAGILNAEKVLSPMGYSKLQIKKYSDDSLNLWTRGTVTAILCNRVYIGDLIMRKTRNLLYDKREIIQIPKDRWLISENHHEPIIALNDFNQVQKILDSRKNRTISEKRHKTLNDYLGKKLFCGGCGRKMKSRVWDKKVYYICPRRVESKYYCNVRGISVENIKENVFEFLQLKIEQIEKYQESQYNYEQSSSYKIKRRYLDNKMDALSEQRNSLNTKLFDFYIAKSDGDYCNSDFMLFKTYLDGRANRLDTEMLKIEREIKDYDENISSNSIWLRTFLKYKEYQETQHNYEQSSLYKMKRQFPC